MNLATKRIQRIQVRRNSCCQFVLRFHGSVVRGYASTSAHETIKGVLAPDIGCLPLPFVMDIKTLLYNLHEELSCSVCMCTFTDPKQLPCLHSFCLHCLNGIQRTGGSRYFITCPECRREIRVPESGDFNELPTDFRVNSLLDVMAIKKCNTMGVKCGNCDIRNDQSFYCFQCCSFWCAYCITGHDIIRENKQHRTLALKNFQDQDIEAVLKRPAFCQKKYHEKEELKFFCKLCLAAICNICDRTLHEGHAKVLLEEAAYERKMQVKSTIESQNQEMLRKRNKITKLDENCIKIKEQVNSTKRNVQRFVDNVIRTIEARKQEVFAKVESEAKESVERLEARRCELENEVKLIKTEVEKSEALLKRSTSAEIVRLGTIFQKEAVRNEGELVDCDIEGFRHFTFKENEALMHKAKTEGIGSFETFVSRTKAQQCTAEGKGISEVINGLEAEFVVTTRNSQQEQFNEEFDNLTVEIRNRQGHDCAKKVQVQDNKDGTYKISYFAKETETCEASVKVNGEHVRGSPFKVLVRPRQFRPVLSFGQEGSSVGMMHSPWGLAVNERNEIIVADTRNNRVQIFRSDGTCLTTFGRKGDRNRELNFPTGIACDRNNDIFVVDCNNHRIKKFSDKGNFLCQIGGEGSLDHQLHNPRGVSLDSDGNIIVADSGNKKIKIFSPTGEFLHKFGVEGSFIQPYGAVEKDKHFFVSDSGDHSIKVFSKEERKADFLYKFGKNGKGDGELNQPRGLSFNNLGHLMVCDSENHRVQVFETSGKFVTKFGAKGSKKGQFNKPINAVDLSDGRIVVSDFYNHVIHVFE